MTYKSSLLLFLVLLLAAAVFIDQTAGMLPERLASHFDGGGAAKGFSTRSEYLKFIYTFTLGLPPAIVMLVSAMVRIAPALVNVPHREYWMAPERRDQTFAFLAHHAVWIGILLLLFLSYVHWLVVAANLTVPAHLDGASIYGGLGVLLLAMAGWVAVLFGKFKAPAGKNSTPVRQDIARPHRPRRPS